MRKGLKRQLFVAVLGTIFLALPVTGFADTLVLKNGTQISGYYEGGTSRVIRFRTESGLGEYDLLTVEEIRFGGDVVSSSPRVVEPVPVPPPAPVVEEGGGPPELVRAEPEADVEEPRLQTREEAADGPEASSAANTAWTIPTGSMLTVRMIDGIDGEVNQVGETFTATLAQVLQVEGIEVAPRGADIRGRIAQVSGAGRVRGSAELRLELTQIVVNGVPYALNTSEYTEVTEGRGEETARRVGTAAGIGAIIGAIAGGGQGAAIGAGIGAGAAGTVQVLTRGEQLYIPAETLLGFTLREPLIIAAR
jgi:hypothetical protein